MNGMRKKRKTKTFIVASVKYFIANTTLTIPMTIFCLFMSLEITNKIIQKPANRLTQ